MREFAYARAESVADALAHATTEHMHYLGGGTNLVDLMKLGVETPELLVDVTAALPDDIVWDRDAVRIGAAVRNTDLAVDPGVRARYPMLSEALLAGASGQLRNVATVGGNLLQRTRCFYFQDTTKPCNKRAAGSGCPAREGEHHNLAVLGASAHCIATHPSDMAVPLAALDARVGYRTDNGADSIALTAFYRSPDEDAGRETVLPPGALITHVDIPPLSFGARSRYVKVRERASYAFAIGSVAAALDVRDGIVADVRLAFGAVAPMPWRAFTAEDALRGRPAEEDSFRAAVDAELDAARPLRDNGYKIELIRNLVVRTLGELASEVSA